MREELLEEIEDEAPEKEKSLEDIINESIIPQGIKVPEPEVVFGLNGIPIMTKGSISTLIGKAKAGKTTVTAWISAQTIKEGLKMIWFDTEQGLYYGSRTQHWILDIAYMEKSSNLIYMDLKIYKPAERAEIIETSLRLFEPDLIVLDGSRDLVYDINDPKEATEVSGLFMKWAVEYNLHILTILHVNKGDGNARGHLGTELLNKSETTLRIVHNKEENRVECEPENSRGKGFETFAFDRDDRGIPQLIEGFAEMKVSSNIKKETFNANDADLQDDHIQCISTMFLFNEWLKYSDVINQIKLHFESIGKKIGNNKAGMFLEYYRNEAMMIYDQDQKGHAKWRSGLVKKQTLDRSDEF